VATIGASRGSALPVEAFGLWPAISVNAHSLGKKMWPGFAIATALLFQSGYALAQTAGPNLNLTKATGNQYETAVAINPNNNNQIFVVSRNELGGLYTARSSDGGVTWNSRLIAQMNLPAAGDIPRAYGNSSVAWDTFGNLFLAYLSQGSVKAATYVSLSLSTDGGSTFYSPTGEGPVLMLPTNPPSPPVIGDQPTVTVGAGSAGFPSSVWVTYWTIGGIAVSGAGVSGLGAVGPFASMQPVQPAGVNFGDIAVGPNGEVMITYGPNAGSGAIYTNVKPDGLGPNPFSTFAAAVPVNIGGFTHIPAQPNWGIDPEAGLAWDCSTGPHHGRVYLVYTDATAVASADTNIFVLRSDDIGATWSNPVRVNDDTGTNSQFLPRISLDQSNGMIAVTWYDARNSALNNTAQYFGSFSSDGGATFGANFQIAGGTSDQARSVATLHKADYGDYTGNAFVNGRLVPAWADNSNSTGDNPDGATDFDVYTAIVSAPALFDFDTGTPPLTTGRDTPFDQTSNGITAHFSSSADPAFSIQSDATTGWKLSQFSGKYLYANNQNGNALDIQFSQLLTGVTLTFATADFQQAVMPTAIQLTGYLDSTATPAVGSATARGTYTSDTMSMGMLSFNAGGRPFNLVEVAVPPQSLGAGAFLVDDIVGTVAAPTPLASVSAASYLGGAPLAAGSITAAFGQGLATGSQAANSLPLPTSLVDTTLKVKDAAGVEWQAPLFCVTPTQINYLVPDGAAPGPATVTVTSAGQVTGVGTVNIAIVAPGLFTANSDGRGPPAGVAVAVAPALTQSTQPVASCSASPGSCVTSPIDLGPGGTQVVLVLYGTGIRGRSSLGGVAAKIGGVDAEVQYAGAQSQFPGLDQVNVVIPRELAGHGEVDLALTVDGKTANTVRVNIR
jgi:uncharacterized protein (TIGR03437 family)